jgi:hypothetical protein
MQSIRHATDGKVKAGDHKGRPYWALLEMRSKTAFWIRRMQSIRHAPDGEKMVNEVCFAWKDNLVLFFLKRIYLTWWDDW